MRDSGAERRVVSRKRGPPIPRMTCSCSKASHSATRACAKRSDGSHVVPLPRYQRIAPDCVITRPSSSSSTGVSRAGFSCA